MADRESSILPPPSPEQRRAAAGQFERANQVIATGNYDYGIQLLLTCCKLDPSILIYRQTLRQTEKAKYKNNLHGSRLSLLTTSAARAKLKSARRAHDHLRVFECAEDILLRNPWDTGAQVDMAEAANALGLLDLAIWTLEQARQKELRDVTVNRSLARLYEQRGNFSQAIALWELVRQADPNDVEAQRKGQDLAATAHLAVTQSPMKTLAAAAPVEEAAETDDVVEAAPTPQADRAGRETSGLRSRLAADPTNANLYLQLASVYRRAGQVEQARQVLEQALSTAGNQFDLMVEMADLDIEPFRQNLALVEERLRTEPQDSDLRTIRIRLRKEINTRELDLYRHKADRYPTEKGHRFELGVRLLRAQQVEEAIRELQAIRSDPRYLWRVLLYLGFCFRNRNNWRLAERNFEEALEHLPASEEGWRKEILFALAQGSADSGALARALDWAHDLAHIDYSFRDIGRLLDEWHARLNNGQGPPA